MTDSFDFEWTDAEIAELQQLAQQYPVVKKLMEANPDSLGDPALYFKNKLAKLAIALGNDIEIRIMQGEDDPDHETAAQPRFLTKSKSDASFERMLALIVASPKMLEALSYSGPGGAKKKKQGIGEGDGRPVARKS